MRNNFLIINKNISIIYELDHIFLIYDNDGYKGKYFLNHIFDQGNIYNILIREQKEDYNNILILYLIDRLKEINTGINLTRQFIYNKLNILEKELINIIIKS